MAISANERCGHSGDFVRYKIWDFGLTEPIVLTSGQATTMSFSNYALRAYQMAGRILIVRPSTSAIDRQQLISDCRTPLMFSL